MQHPLYGTIRKTTQYKNIPFVSSGKPAKNLRQAWLLTYYFIASFYPSHILVWILSNSTKQTHFKHVKSLNILSATQMFFYTTFNKVKTEDNFNASSLKLSWCFLPLSPLVKSNVFFSHQDIKPVPSPPLSDDPRRHHPCCSCGSPLHPPMSNHTPDHNLETSWKPEILQESNSIPWTPWTQGSGSVKVSLVRFAAFQEIPVCTSQNMSYLRCSPS